MLKTATQPKHNIPKMTKLCESCISLFEPRYGYEYFCKRCFYKLHHRRTCFECGTVLWSKIIDVSQYILCKSCIRNAPETILYLQKMIRKLSGELERIKRSTQATPNIPYECVKVFLMLCHTDRHQGPLSKKAHEATLILLEIKKYYEKAS